MIDSLKSHLPLQNIQTITPFNKGWSDDRKFIVVTDDNKYLLRVGDINNKNRYIQHARLLEQAAENGLPTHRLIAHGTLLADTHYFLLLGWLAGDDAEDVITSFSQAEQYNLGLEAGKILKVIHNFKPVSASSESWAKRFNRKIDRKIEMYENCELKYENGHLLQDVVSKYRHLLENKKVVQHHGDFHIGNMLIDENDKLHIIDFDRHDTGEPYEEFNRITWCASLSPAFASGRIDGYFNNDVPDEFWELLLLYISSNMLSSLPWAIPFGDKEITTMRKSYAEILDWYDDFIRVVPNWYKIY